VLVTVLCACLGWLGMQIKWKRDRHAAIESGEIVALYEATRTAPWGLRLVGEPGIVDGYVQDPGDSASRGQRVQEIRSLFPETELQLVDMNTMRLDRPTSFDFRGDPLQDGIDYLKEYHQIEIQFDLRALEEIGIVPTEATVTALVKVMRLHAALHQILAQANRSLTFMIKDEVLLITSEQQKNIYELRLKEQRAALRARPPQPQSARLLKALDSPTSFDFEDTPLQDATDYLKKYHGIEIELDAEALKTRGIDPQLAEVNTRVKGISLRSGLNLMLMRLDDALTYMMRGDVLVITTRGVAGERAADVAQGVHHDNSR